MNERTNETESEVFNVALSVVRSVVNDKARMLRGECSKGFYLSI